MADEYITVMAGPKLAPGKVALWEVDPDHPENEEGVHEVFIAAPPAGKDAESHRVGMTAEVGKRLAAGTLVQAGGPRTVRVARMEESAEPETTESETTEPETSPTRGRGR